MAAIANTRLTSGVVVMFHMDAGLGPTAIFVDVSTGYLHVSQNIISDVVSPSFDFFFCLFSFINIVYTDLLGLDMLKYL